MPASRKAEAQHQSGPSKSKGKRKHHEGQAEETTPRKQRKPILDLFSSSQQSSKASEPLRTPKQKQQNSCAEHGREPFADMYLLPTKPKTNGCIDLTGSSPPASPVPRGRNPSITSPVRPVTSNAQQGPKKLIVKNFRTTPRVDPEVYFEKVWSEQDSSLTAIFHNEKVSYSLEELYKGSENVCRQGKAPELYKRLRRKCKQHLTEEVSVNLKKSAGTSLKVDALKACVHAWSTWRKQLVTVRQIFYYLDQAYLLRSSDHPSISETGLVLFRRYVFSDCELKARVLGGVLDLFDLDRQGKISDEGRTLLRQSIDTFHELNVYTSDFEPIFRDASEAHFLEWRRAEEEIADLAHYGNACTELLEQEMTRCDLLTLDRTTRSQLCELFDRILVEEKVDFMIEEGSLLDLFENDKVRELEQIYTLLQRKGHGEKIGPSFNRYIIDEGSAIVFDEKNEADMVINLLDFKRRLDHYLKVSFHGNHAMDNGMHKSFEHFINKTKKTQSNWDTDNAKPGEMIAKHVDLLLKGGVKAVPKLAAAAGSDKAQEEHDFDEGTTDEDAEINMHLSNALDLFRFVHGKAVFEAFYKKDLARRLLMGRSASNDAERNMLTRLKNECGAGFTHNLESMFKDMDLARDEMASYNQLLEDRGAKTAGPDLSVNVLSAAAWPTYPDVPVNIPTNIAKVMADFERHYKLKHSGRKLTWKNALAHCQLKAKFPKGNKEIVVSAFQAIVLLLFNDIPTDATLGYKDIKAATGLSDAEVKRTLQSLACAKYRVLTKTPKGRDVNETDKFAVNLGFQDPKLRIKINQIQLKETKEENKETHERVAADRHYETQAAIVRIMKSRKKIRHVELISEVIKATKSRGVLDPSDIKKNIERLIEKDYMEREENNTYSYVA